jgi:hypothetical protein
MWFMSHMRISWSTLSVGSDFIRKDGNTETAIGARIASVKMRGFCVLRYFGICWYPATSALEKIYNVMKSCPFVNSSWFTTNYANILVIISRLILIMISKWIRFRRLLGAEAVQMRSEMRWRPPRHREMRLMDTIGDSIPTSKTWVRDIYSILEVV